MAARSHRKGQPVAARRNVGQPRIDPAAVLERRSVGLPPSWWREIDQIAARGNVKTASVVRLAVGVYLKRMRKIDNAIKKNRRGQAAK